jgi:filamentous hemagglutinin family protein
MKSFRHLLLLTTALTAFGLAAASAGPNGPTVVGGSATVTNPGSNNVTVNQQTDKAIINWHLFDVGANEKVQFVQPNSGSITLNRVTGGLGPSMILGTVDANGRVFIINRDGILFGANSVINTSGFLATTHDIRNNDFMAGRFNFNIPGRPDASIVNLGTITANNGGFAALVAPGVRNSGTITATMGTVTLASGNGFSLDFYGDRLVTLNVGDEIAASVKDVATGLPLKALVSNDGKIKADGGRVELTAAAARQVVDAVINTSGVIEANTIGTKNGMIVLSAATEKTKPAGAPVQTVKVSGTLKATGTKQAGTRGGEQTPTAKGGTVIVTGENIVVAGARIDVSGDNGGGKVLIGGDWGGGKPDKSLVSNPSAVLETYLLPTATTVSVDAATTIDASAKMTGNGGKVILWADNQLTFAGTILALGGKTFGNGGFVETSAKTVDISGSVNAPGGTWLLDPASIIVDGTLAGTISTTLNNGTNYVLATGTTAAGGDGDITVSSQISWNTSATLTLAAYNNIVLNDLGSKPNIVNFGGAAGNLVLHADSTGKGSGTILMSLSTFNNRVDWTASTGNIAVYYNPSSYTSPTNFTTPSSTGRFTLASPSQLTAYMLVNDARNLRDIDTNLAGNYALGRNITDFTSFPNFAPIGDISHPFTGKFDGLGNTISNLTIAPNNATLQSIGLFSFIGSTGVVSNLNFTNANVSANPGFNSSINSQWVGILAGTNAGTITNVTASGTVNGLNLVGVIAGGLVGQNGTLGPGGHPGTITMSSANVTVTVGDGGACPGSCNFNAAGGLVGANIGSSTISHSHADGNVTGGTSVFIGGLAGYNGFIVPAAPGTITNSYATGNVTMTGPIGAAGGLVGTNSPGSVITDSQALGSVTALANQTTNNFNFLSAGGLVGQNSGTIAGTTTPPAATTTACAAGASWSCAGGAVNVGASAHAGGLVGDSNGIIVNTFATGNVTGAAGLTNLNNSGDPTTLGGLVGSNNGLIATSFATGNVGAPNVANLTVGGLVGENSGTILASAAFGTVRAGDNSVAGGLVGNNSPFDFCNCSPGDGSLFFNSAFIGGSTAFGNVTVGSMSLAGGFVGGSDGFLVSSSAHGNVTGAGNTFLGGFAGVSGFHDSLGPNNFGAITFATATGSVTSTGPNSTIGGLVGANMSQIVNSSASGPVTGTSNSFLGGLVGINLGKITDSSTPATATVTAPGANNIMGGLVGMNVGWIDPSTSAGNVTGGPNSIVGGFVGANVTFTNFAPGLIPGSTFPVGTISPGSFGTGTATGGPGSTVSPQVASNNPSGSVPAYPSPIQSCDAAGCVILKTGTFGPVGPNPEDQKPDTATISPLLVLTQQLLKDPNDTKQGDPVPNTTTTNTTTPGAPGTPGGPKPGGPGPGGTKPPSWFGPNAVLGSGMPALTETRFANDEIVVQLRSDLTKEQMDAFLREFGLSVITSQELGLLGRTVYRFKITSGMAVRALIPLFEKKSFTAQAQPSYVFELAQAPAGNETAPKGDSAQYIVPKLRLPDVHLLATGKGVLVAVVDSTIDVNHPDLSGVIEQRFDAVGAQLAPHAHGTGMAGAIASHKRLLGVAPNARLLAIQAFGVNAGSAQGTSLAIVKGLNWAVEQGAKVINMSFAGPKDPILEQAIKALREKGVILIAAAGNAGPKSPPLFPGADPNVIAVSATDADDAVYKNANRGKYVAIAAPGVDILVPAPDGGYQLTTGTSVAAAHVSGVVALLLERNPSLKPDDVRRILTSTATKLKGARPEEVGAGLVDPYDALLKLAPKTATIH